MAAQVRRAAAIEKEQAYVDFYYDDVDNLVTRVGWANGLDVEVIVSVKKQDGTVLLDTRMPAHTAPATRTLSGPNRFNIEDDLGRPFVNLSS